MHYLLDWFFQTLQQSCPDHRLLFLGYGTDQRGRQGDSQTCVHRQTGKRIKQIYRWRKGWMTDRQIDRETDRQSEREKVNRQRQTNE